MYQHLFLLFCVLFVSTDIYSSSSTISPLMIEKKYEYKDPRFPSLIFECSYNLCIVCEQAHDEIERIINCLKTDYYHTLEIYKDLLAKKGICF